MEMVQQLAELIRDRIDAGVLPRIVHTRRWVGYGQSLRCDACGEPILRAQVEHEFEFDECPPIRLHAACARLYEAALQDQDCRPTD
jgi:hypothetical protein